MIINPNKLKIPFKHRVTYSRIYRGYHRMKFQSNYKSTEFGKMSMMVSRKTSYLVLHVIHDNLYLRYPQKTRDYNTLNQYMKHAVSWKNKYINKLKKYKTKKLYPYEFYSTTDKIIRNYGINKSDIPKALKMYFSSEYRDTKYAFFEIMMKLCDRDNVHIIDQIEPIIANMAKWIDNFPYDRLYRPIYNLEERPLHPQVKAYTKRLPFEDFEKIVDDWTHDELIEAIGRYKRMSPHDYFRDPKRILYAIMEIGRKTI